jgi:hypothetical protein
MKKKILFFNYFMQKCVQKEQELLGVEDFSSGLLGLVLSHTNMMRRFANGCSMEEICFVHRYYPVELFLAVCLDAKLNGDNLISAFDFKEAKGLRGNVYREFFVKEDDLDCYLETIIPSVKSKDDVNFEAYYKVTGFVAEELLQKSYRLDNLCSITTESLELPEECEEIKMIDRAWERLSKDINFTNLFDIGNKHTPRSQSLAVCYCTSEKYKALFEENVIS